MADEVLVAYASTKNTENVFLNTNEGLNANEYKIAKSKDVFSSQSFTQSSKNLYYGWIQQALKDYGDYLGFRRQVDGTGLLLVASSVSSSVATPPKFVAVATKSTLLTLPDDSKLLEKVRDSAIRSLAEMDANQSNGFLITDIAVTANNVVYIISEGQNNFLFYASLARPLTNNTATSNNTKPKSSDLETQAKEVYARYGRGIGQFVKGEDGKSPKNAEEIGGLIRTPTLKFYVGIGGNLVKDTATLERYRTDALKSYDQLKKPIKTLKISGIIVDEDNLPYYLAIDNDGLKYNLPINVLTDGYKPLNDKLITKLRTEAAREDASKDLELADSYDPKTAFYRIIYKDSEEIYKSFVFAFAPARESRANGWNVPESKTGIPVHTTMRHKMQVVPGAGPVVQTIGVGGTKLTVVGALIGNESVAYAYRAGTPNVPKFYEVGSNFKVDNPNVSALEGAIDVAKTIDRELVQPGRVVTLEVKPANNQSSFKLTGAGLGDFIRYTGVITAVRFQFVHVDRAYYAIDMFVTDYPLAINSKDKAPVEAATADRQQPTSQLASANSLSNSTEVGGAPSLVGNVFESLVTSIAGRDYSNVRPSDPARSNEVSRIASLGADFLKQTVATYSPPFANYLAQANTKTQLLALARDGDTRRAVGSLMTSSLSAAEKTEALNEIVAFGDVDGLAATALERLG
jgi:hypothetical protein